MFAFLFFVIPAANWTGWLWYIGVPLLALGALWELWYLPKKNHGGDIRRAFQLGVVALIGFGSMIWLRTLEHGFELVMVGIIAVSAYDTFGSIIGSLFGKTKGVAENSPGKSMEGFIGGILLGALATLIAIIWLLSRTEMQSDFGLASGLLASALCCMGLPYLAMEGDLFASGVKRNLGNQDVRSDGKRGIDDFSRLFGSHGGVMDRFDSWVMAFPLLLLISLVVEYLP